MDKTPRPQPEPRLSSVTDPYRPEIGSRWRMITDVTVLDVSDDNQLVTFIMNGRHYEWFLSVFLSVFSQQDTETEK